MKLTCWRFKNGILLVIQRLDHFLHVISLQRIRLKWEFNFVSFDFDNHREALLDCFLVFFVYNLSGSIESVVNESNFK
jgi:hypothetical protein